MESWSKFTSNVGPIGQKITRQFGNLNQQARETFGQVEADDITELPEEYRKLEERVDALKNAHLNLGKIAKAYETEGYDYPTQVQESLTQISAQVGHSVTSWAASAAKQTNVNVNVPVTSAPPTAHKTLHHALSRGAASGALELGASSTDLAGVSSPVSGKPSSGAGAEESKLGEALQKFALAQDRVGNLRLQQDESVKSGFLTPWNAFGAQIQLAVKARQNVREARLHLDSWRQAVKQAEVNRKTEKVESMRSDVELAEDKLVSATEEAISVMKRVLEDPQPIKSLAAFVKAQAEFHQAAQEVYAEAANTLASAATSAESDYMSSR
ncbi:uncharacterized protein FA14DRAFT_172621 [Meira miltonrushii]|uniref:BAR domain-containing protein n=1 Tax=Meira miltonrushii TaxID=1280837 RepID=A0A316VET3_9BASI|nr:uncharacterized protein FA14DRAFT_172621 [Meira miltonrushii]PWN36036.1 hypothetical protein FA14DRAFT_172621 [Meira miltonrushii]